MPARLWFLSEIYYPDETSTGFIVTRLAEAEARTRPVAVLCGFPRYDSRGSRVRRFETRNGVVVERCPGTTLPKDSVVGRLLNLLTITVSMTVRAAWRVHRGELVVITTNPPILPFPIALLMRIKGARTFLLIHDVYPEVLIAAGVIGATSLPARLLTRLGSWLYGRADGIAVCGRDMEALVLSRAGDSPPRLALVRNWGDTDNVVPLARHGNQLLVDLGLADKFIVQYAGNMGPVHDIELIVDAAEQVQLLRPEVHFLFIGSGSKVSWIHAQVGARRLTNVTILGPQPRDNQAMFLNACDVAIAAFVPGMFGAGVPSRMYNVLAAGKPWIAAVDENSEMGLVIQEEGAGWVVQPRDSTGFITAIVAAVDDRPRLAEMGVRGRRAVEDKYSFRSTLESLDRLLQLSEAPK